MKKRRKAALCALLCCGLLIGCSPLKTLPDPEPEVTATPSPSPAATPKPAPAEAPSGTEEEQREKTDKDKEETVYIKAGADGEAREVTVETVLRCRGTDGTIADRTRLTDIKNTEGDEDFRQGKNGSLTWEDHGEDIHYEGKSRDPLPVGVKIRYTLNGRPIRPEDLAGKSGHLKIRFDYENRTQETREVSIYGGEAKSIQTRVPFLAVSFAMLPKEVFSHVECKNGRLLSLGEQNAFLGFALPGLPDALTLSDNKLTEELDIPTYAELEADVTDFEMDFTATVFSNGLLEDLEQKDLNDLYDLAGEFDTLYDAAAQLAEGSEKLGDGMSAYVGGVNSALQTAKDLAADLPAVTAELERIGSEVDGLKEMLSEEPESLDASAETLEALAAQMQGIQAILQTVEGSRQTASEKVGDAAAALDDARAAVNEIGSAETGVSGADLLWAEVGGQEGLYVAGLDELQSRIETIEDEELRNELSALSENLYVGGTEGLYGVVCGVDQLGVSSGEITGTENVEAALDDAGARLAEAQEAVDHIGGVGSEVLEQAAAAMGSAAESTRTAAETIAAIRDSEVIRGFLTKIANMTGSLDGKIPENTDLGAALQSLMDAGTTLNKGLHKLEDGNAAFRDGIAELADAGGWKLRRLTRELDAMRAADLAYCNFGGIAEGRSGSVRFIIETDAIEK